MLLSVIRERIIQAVKNRDQVEAGTLRFLLAAVRNRAIEKYGSAGEASLTDADILEVIARQVKSHRESITAYRNAGRTDLVAKEEAELVILSAFLPQELTEQELKEIIKKAIGDNPAIPFGPLMGKVMTVVNGRAEGAKVRSLLAAGLSGS